MPDFGSMILYILEVTNLTLPINLLAGVIDGIRLVTFCFACIGNIHRFSGHFE